MVFHKCFRLFDALVTYIFIIVIITYWGLSLFFLSFQVHFLELIFSDNQGNGTVSNVLAIIMWPLSGSWGVVTRRVTHIWRTTFLSSWCWMSPFFYSVSRPLDLCKANRSPGDKKTNKKKKKQRKETKNWKCHQLWLDSWTKKGDLANTTKALTKERGWKWLQTMRNTKSVAFPHVSLTHVHRHMHPELHT